MGENGCEQFTISLGFPSGQLAEKVVPVLLPLNFRAQLSQNKANANCFRHTIENCSITLQSLNKEKTFLLSQLIVTRSIVYF